MVNPGRSDCALQWFTIRRMIKKLHDALALRFEKWQDRRWDERHNVATSQIIYTDDLTVHGDNAEHAVEHDPSPVSHTNRLLDALPASGNETFIDFGSGQGRLVLLAAQRFDRVIGVEFAKELVATCRENIDAYKGSRKCVPDIREQDATEFEFPDGGLVVWFYAPFRPPVMTPVLENLSRSYAADPRPIHVMYCNNFHRELFDSLDWLSERELTIKRGLFVDRVPWNCYASKEAS